MVSIARRSTSSTTSKRCRGESLTKAFKHFVQWSSKPLVQLCKKCGVLHRAPSIGMVVAFPGKYAGLARKVDTAAIKPKH